MATQSPGMAKGKNLVDFTQVADNISYAAAAGLDDSSVISLTGKLKREKFDRKNRFQCTFWFGKNCSKEVWTKCKGPLAIQGLHSNMIEGKLIGSQRPSTRLIKEHGVIP